MILHLSVLDFLLLQSLKMEVHLRLFQGLMSYLIQELTNWWPLLFLRWKFEGRNRLSFYVEKSGNDMCGGFSMIHTNAKLSNVALLHLFQSCCRGFFQCCIYIKNGPKIV